MEETVEITGPGGQTRQVPFGTRLSELFGGTGLDAALAAIVNGETVDLATRITDPAVVTPLFLADRSGYAVYARSAAFLLTIAVHELFPDADVVIEHGINTEIAATITDGRPFTSDDIAAVRDRMRHIVAENSPIERVKIKRDEAVRLFTEAGMDDKLAVMRATNRTYLTLYRCRGRSDYLYGALVPSMGAISVFDLVEHGDGVLLLLPHKHPPHTLSGVVEMPKVRAAFAEAEHWARIVGATNVGDINTRATIDAGRDMVLMAEALHEKKISQIADAVADDLDHTRLVLIAGPSSSGKTTFSKRLAIQLRVLGLEPFPISADDYFRDWADTPRDAEGNLDFESLGTVNVPLLNRDLATLLDGGTVPLGRFDFVHGQRNLTGASYAMGARSILILEGIHGLNDALTPAIAADEKFRIYASALCPVNLDNHTSVYVSDVRTLRRLVRDHRTRGADAERTLQLWPSVRAGEDRNIFPFQESADVVFNSALLYELNALKPQAAPLLEHVDRESGVYGEAMRMLEFLSFFKSLPPTYIPPNSIAREFLGGSVFDA